MAYYRYLEVTRHKDVAVARFVEHTLVSDLAISAAADELYSLADDEECQKLLLSFAGVKHLSSQMLAKLIALHKYVKKNGGDLKLCEISPRVHEIFALVRLDRLLDIRDTEEHALEAFAKGAVNK
jgi:anti-sigma B factor antagonist